MEYPWFELQEDSADITQGDIIKGCPVPILKEFDISEEGQNVKAEIATIDGIALTQACDIANKKLKILFYVQLHRKAILRKYNEALERMKKRLEKILTESSRGSKMLIIL